MFFLINNFLTENNLLQENEISSEVAIGVWIGSIIFGILFLVLGYKLIQYGIEKDSVVAIVIGILAAGFWLGILFYFLLKRKQDRKNQEKEAAKRREEELLRDKTSK